MIFAGPVAPTETYGNYSIFFFIIQLKLAHYTEKKVDTTNLVLLNDLLLTTTVSLLLFRLRLDIDAGSGDLCKSFTSPEYLKYELLNYTDKTNSNFVWSFQTCTE